MPNQMSPGIRAKVAPVEERWNGFVRKVSGRIEEIMAEANAGLDELIQAAPVEHAPWGAAWGTLSSRVSGLDQKIGEAREKLDAELDAIRDLDDIAQSDHDAVLALGRAWLEQERAIRRQLERNFHTFETRKWADRARALYALARVEAERPAPCTSCGAPLTVTGLWESSNVKCGHCGVQNSVSPGPAGGQYWGSLHYVAVEGSFAELYAEQDAKAQYDRYRCPTAADFDTILRASHAFYTKYNTLLKSMNPGFVGTVEEATAANMKHHTAWDQPRDQLARQFYGKLLDAVKRRDKAQTTALMQNLPDAVTLDECTNAVYERGGDRAGAEFVLQIEHQLTDESDPLKPWLAEKVESLVRHTDVVK
jgi:hypothetical protein